MTSPTSSTSSTTPVQQVGFVGMGLMGSRMAKNLAAKGHTVLVWNRSVARAAETGLPVASTPRELAERSEVVCTCLADPRAMEQVLEGPDGLLAGLRAGQLFIDFGTMSVAFVEALGRRCAERQVELVDAPVTGSKNGAQKGTLLIMCGGSEAAVQRAMPVFQGVGEKVVHCGPLTAGTQVKLAGNALLAAMLQALSEGMLTVSRGGVDPRKLLEVVQASGYRSPYFDFKGQAILARDFETHFEVDLMHKDLAQFLERAAELKVPTPLAATLRETYNLARAAGKGKQDIGAVITAYEALAGHQVK